MTDSNTKNTCTKQNDNNASNAETLKPHDANYKKPALPSKPTQEEVHEFFRDDTFAYQQADCRIIECYEGHGVAEMVLNPSKHFNAENNVMGGAIFTLADYAFAAAVMPNSAAAVSLVSTIEFIKASKGKKLIATCNVDKTGHRVGFYTTEIYDDEGTYIAKVVTTCYRP